MENAIPVPKTINALVEEGAEEGTAAAAASSHRSTLFPPASTEVEEERRKQQRRKEMFLGIEEREKRRARPLALMGIMVCAYVGLIKGFCNF